MRVVQDYPPNYEAIEAAFHPPRNAIFCYGDTIYSPHVLPVPGPLVAHEYEHCKRQGKDVEGWWAAYIASAEFRLAEEIPAHQAEFRAYAGAPRKRRRLVLKLLAKRLSGKLYGGLLSFERAKAVIKEKNK